MADTVCVYCKAPLAAHAAAPIGGACWRQCRDGTGRAVHIDTHFRPNPGWRWAGDPHPGRQTDWLLARATA